MITNELGATTMDCWLSDKDIPADERLIFALDLPSIDAAKAMVERLGDSVKFYKIGLELFMAGDYFEFLNWLSTKNKKIFVDLKFFDVPETVGRAVARLRDHPATFATVHGNDAILEAACRAKGTLKILAVTILTSLDRGDLDDLGFAVDVQALVLSRARRAIKLGCDGVISSGLEVNALRQDSGKDFLIIVPGIRPVENRATDDQKRTVDVEEAFRKGADYIVVGRPIRDAENPRAAAEAIQQRINTLFAKSR